MVDTFNTVIDLPDKLRYANFVFECLDDKVLDTMGIATCDSHEEAPMVIKLVEKGGDTPTKIQSL